MSVVMPIQSALASMSLRRAAAMPLVIIACTALLNGCGGGGGGGGGFGVGSGTGPAPRPPVSQEDPLAPAAPVDLDKAPTLWEIQPDGVGGDAGGDGGVGGAAGDGSPLGRITVILKDATPLPVVP